MNGKTSKRSVVSVNPGNARDESYKITLASGLFQRVPSLITAVQRQKRLKIHRLAIITDSRLRKIYGKRLSAWFDRPASLFHVPAGEASKCREMKDFLEDRMIAGKFGRDTAIIAFGGGVVGDLAGFVASTYLRGIPCFQVPTTIISQVDSSVGGKTAIDLPSGKNLIGAFYQPAGVFIDVDLLDTLPEGEFVNGMAEVIKHAMIRDPAFFSFLEDHAACILARDRKILVEMLRRSCLIKAAVVSEDPRERDLRKTLNFGHTVGHALETLSGYALHHGQAVSIGMVAEAYLAWKAGYLRSEKYLRLTHLLRRFGLPTRVPESLTPGKIIKAMDFDKKNEGGRIHAALPCGIGKMKTIHGKYGLPLNMALLNRALKDLLRMPDAL